MRTMLRGVWTVAFGTMIAASLGFGAAQAFASASAPAGAGAGSCPVGTLGGCVSTAGCDWKCRQFGFASGYCEDGCCWCSS